MKHIKLFESWLNENEADWMEMVNDACREFEHSNPGALDKLCNVNPDTMMNDETMMNLYGKAAGCFVEPNVMLGDYDSEMPAWYNEKVENGDMMFVLPAIENLPNSGKWKCIIDLLNEIGY